MDGRGLIGLMKAGALMLLTLIAMNFIMAPGYTKVGSDFVKPSETTAPNWIDAEDPPRKVLLTALSPDCALPSMTIS